MKFEYLRVDTHYNDKNEVVIIYKNKAFDYYDYRAILFDVLGDDGWELITATGVISTDFENQAWIPIYADTIASFVYTSSLVFYFKREAVKDILDDKSKEYKNMFEELKGMNNE
jgi:hypothetical protein